ncbi:MAG: hypothetical protein ACFB00_10795 [Parvularculaceae bacterium]
MLRILLIHGTGDGAPADAERRARGDPKWWEADGRFVDDLKRYLDVDGPFEVEPFAWDPDGHGRNSETARRAGARRLAERVRTATAAGERVAIVAHSHGGNVVERALFSLAGRRDVLDAVEHVVSVGTPFLRHRFRLFSSGGVRIVAAMALGIVALLGPPVLSRVGGEAPSGLAPALWALGLLASVAFLMRWRGRLMARRQETGASSLRVRLAGKWTPVFSARDEAIAALTGAAAGDIAATPRRAFRSVEAAAALALTSAFIATISLWLPLARGEAEGFIEGAPLSSALRDLDLVPVAAVQNALKNGVVEAEIDAALVDASGPSGRLAAWFYLRERIAGTDALRTDLEAALVCVNDGPPVRLGKYVDRDDGLPPVQVFGRTTADINELCELRLGRLTPRGPEDDGLIVPPPQAIAGRIFLRETKNLLFAGPGTFETGAQLRGGVDLVVGFGAALRAQEVENRARRETLIAIDAAIDRAAAETGAATPSNRREQIVRAILNGVSLEALKGSSEELRESGRDCVAGELSNDGRGVVLVHRADLSRCGKPLRDEDVLIAIMDAKKIDEDASADARRVVFKQPPFCRWPAAYGFERLSRALRRRDSDDANPATFCPPGAHALSTYENHPLSQAAAWIDKRIESARDARFADAPGPYVLNKAVAFVPASGAPFLILFFVISLLATTLIGLAARAFDRTIRGATDGLITNIVRSRSFGDDDPSWRLHGVSAQPNAQARDRAWRPLPREAGAIGARLEEAANEALRENVDDFREALVTRLGDGGFVKEGVEALAARVIGGELVHTSYFREPAVRALIALRLAEKVSDVAPSAALESVAQTEGLRATLAAMAPASEPARSPGFPGRVADAARRAFAMFAPARP